MRSRSAGLSLMLFTGVGLLYAPVLGFDFVRYDDQGYVFENAVVLRGLTIDGVRWAFTTTDLSNYHPLTWVSHMLDVQLFGEWAGGHHATNVALHATNTALVFTLLRVLTSRTIESALVAALFASHPQHVESVAWVSDRKDLLAAFFGLLALLAYTRHVRIGSRWAYTALLGAFTACLLSKQMLVTLPFSLLLLDIWPLGRLQSHGRATLCELRLLVAEKLPLFALSAAASTAIYWAQKSGGAVGEIPFLSRVGNALVSVPRYLGHAVWPCSTRSRRRSVRAGAARPWSPPGSSWSLPRLARSTCGHATGTSI